MTNAHSKKFENHAFMLARYFTLYNFTRKHMTLKTTLAIAAGITEEVWTLADLIALTEMAPLALTA